MAPDVGPLSIDLYQPRPSWAMTPNGPSKTFATDTGDVADATGQMAAGVRSGGAILIPGPRGPRLDCTASGAKAITSDMLLPSGAQPLSVMFWVNFSVLTAAVQTVTFWGTTSPGQGLFCGLGGASGFFFASIYGTSVTTSVTPVVGTDYHYAATFDGGTTWKVYINAVLKATGTQTTNIVHSGTSGFWIGNSSFSSPGRCLVDSAKILPVTATASQVAADMARPNASFAQSARSRRRNYAAAAQATPLGLTDYAPFPNFMNQPIRAIGY